MVAACPFPANHGSAASIREMSEALVRLGHTVHVVTYPVQDDIPIDPGVIIHRVRAPFIKPGQVKVGPAYQKFFYDPLMILKLLWTIRRYKIDVIHAHNYEGALIGWFGKVLSRRPMLYNAVNSMTDELPSYNFIKPKRLAVWLGRILDRIVPFTGDFITVVSDDLRNFLIDKGVPESRVRVVPAGVNLDMFSHGNGAEIRARHGLGQRPVVVYTGALESFQRIDYLLMAMQAVVHQCPQAQLLMVGNIANPERREHYKALAAGFGIADHVTFLDSVPLRELPNYLAAADVAVVPRPECPGHPVKLLNYMAAGKAIVSFQGGAKGLLHMYNGYLAADHDTHALAKGVIFLLEHRDLAKVLGTRARATISGNFDWETLARGIAVTYRMILARKDTGYIEELNRYIKPGYTLSCVERRRTQLAVPVSRRSGHVRRQRADPIAFLEQRHVDFVGQAEVRTQCTKITAEIPLTSGNYHVHAT